MSRISVKALQARFLRSELCSRIFISGCLRGSLEQDHSFSTLVAPFLPIWPAGLQQWRSPTYWVFLLLFVKKKKKTACIHHHTLIFEKCRLEGTCMMLLPEVLDCKLFYRDGSHCFTFLWCVLCLWKFLLTEHLLMDQKQFMTYTKSCGLKQSITIHC